jgi:hypothetical protein
MANKSLNDKYGIPFLSEWEHKDGGIYTALVVEHSFRNSRIPIVCYLKQLTDEERQEWHKKGIMNQFVRTVAHFKSSFKLKEQ